MKNKKVKIILCVLLSISIITLLFNYDNVVRAISNGIHNVIVNIASNDNSEKTNVETVLDIKIDQESKEEVLSVKLDNLQISSGNGTIDEPYLISTSEDLVLLSNYVWNLENTKGIYFKQTANISLKNIDFDPIGSLGVPFEGIYDGGNYEVSDINIDTTNAYQGLFGFVTGEVKNLTVKGNIKVHMRNDFDYDYSYVGGVVGAIQNGAIIDNCKNYVNVEGDIDTGGVVGVCFDNDFTKVGSELLCTISNCENYGNIVGNDKYTGGIIGLGSKNLTVNNCKNYGNVKGIYCVSGIVGSAYNLVDNCENNGTISGLEKRDNIQFVAGICGYTTGHINNSTNKGNISGLVNTGGIVGKSIGTIANCENTANVNGTSLVGGIVGYSATDEAIKSGIYTISEYTSVTQFTNKQINCANTKATIINCKNNGEISSNDTETGRIGGIAGAITSLDNKNTSTIGTIIIGCLNSGNINGAKQVGGIVGWAYKTANTSIIKYCYQLGDNVYMSSVSPSQLNGTGNGPYWLGRNSTTGAIILNGEGACAHYSLGGE